MLALDRKPFKNALWRERGCARINLIFVDTRVSQKIHQKCCLVLHDVTTILFKKKFSISSELVHTGFQYRV